MSLAEGLNEADLKKVPNFYVRCGGCTVHDFEKSTSILGCFGCTVHDIEKLTHTKSEK